MTKLLEKNLTVKEVSEILECSDKHIREIIKRLFPDKMENGKTTYLNEIEITKLKLELDKHHNLERTFDVKTNLEKKLLIKQGYDLLLSEIEDLQKENDNLKIQIIVKNILNYIRIGHKKAENL